MIARLVDAMFGCRHSNYSFPITTKPALRRTAAAAITGTYVVCVAPSGTKYISYWEGFVHAEGGPAHWDATQHMIVSPPTLQLAGRVLLGLETNAAEL